MFLTLATPERDERAEGETGVDRVRLHPLDGGDEFAGELLGLAREGDLHADLGHLEWAEGNISEELSGTGSSSPEGHLGGLASEVLLSNSSSVKILEELVKAELEETLSSITGRDRR